MTETLQTRQDNLERYETELVIREAFPNSTVRTLHSAVKMCDPNALKEIFFIAKKEGKQIVLLSIRNIFLQICKSLTNNSQQKCP